MAGSAQGRAGLPHARPSGNRDMPLAVNLWWAMLLARIDEVFPLQCPRCGEPMRLIAMRLAFVTDTGSITHILAYLGEPTQTPHIAPAARGPPWEEDFDTREGDTFALSEPLPEL